MTSRVAKFPISLKSDDIFGFTAFVGMVIVATFGFPHDAMAQASTMGDIMCSVVSNILPNAAGGGGFGLGNLIVGVAYIAGGVTVGSGLLQLVKWHDNARETPLYQPIWRMIGGTCLLALPSFMNLLLNTLFLNNGPGGIASIVPCGGATANSDGTIVNAQSLGDVITNLSGSLKDPMELLLSVVAIIVGVVFIFRGLVKASRYGTDPRSASPSNIITHLVVGTILVSVGTSLRMIFGTLFGGGDIYFSSDFWNAFNASQWVQQMEWAPGQLEAMETTVTAALTFFQLVGFIAFIRGWMILKSYSEGNGQSTAAAGLTHIIGGAFAINIYQILTIIDNTLGTGFLS